MPIITLLPILCVCKKYTIVFCLLAQAADFMTIKRDYLRSEQIHMVMKSSASARHKSPFVLLKYPST